MTIGLDWFQLLPVPADVMSGTYSLKLVVLSYIIAVLASYVALDLVGRLRAEKIHKLSCIGYLAVLLQWEQVFGPCTLLAC